MVGEEAPSIFISANLYVLLGTIIMLLDVYGNCGRNKTGLRPYSPDPLSNEMEQRREDVLE